MKHVPPQSPLRQRRVPLPLHEHCLAPSLGSADTQTAQDSDLTEDDGSWAPGTLQSLPEPRGPGTRPTRRAAVRPERGRCARRLRCAWFPKSGARQPEPAPSAPPLCPASVTMCRCHVLIESTELEAKPHAARSGFCGLI